LRAIPISSTRTESAAERPEFVADAVDVATVAGHERRGRLRAYFSELTVSS